VTDDEAPTTRTRILETARDLFAERGFQHTSVREIAQRVGLTKTAVLYHFSTKADILAALAEPLLAGLARALAGATSPDPRLLRWQVCEGLLDTYLEHRQSLRLVLRDLALFVQEPMFERFVALTTEANRLVAGPRPDLAAKVRAAQAIAMLSDPVILLADQPTRALRREVLAGVRRLFGGEDGPEGGKRPRAGGRPASMGPEMLATARRMHAGGATMGQIAAALGVSRATLYRHF
jgi:AcrR family transcriptional regulator